MKKTELPTFTFIVEFRGGTYCSQVQAENVNGSICAWTAKIKDDQKKIQFLGDKTIESIRIASMDEENSPILLTGLKNVWHVHYTTKSGNFFINIIRTSLDI